MITNNRYVTIEDVDALYRHSCRNPGVPVRVALAALTKLDQDTTRYDGNVRTAYCESAVASKLNLMRCGEYSISLPNSSLLLRELAVNGTAKPIVCPDGLTRVRAAQRFCEVGTGTEDEPTGDGYSPLMIFESITGDQDKLVTAHCDGNIRVRSLALRTTLSNNGKPIAASRHRLAVQICKYLAGVWAGDITGKLTPTPKEVQEVYTYYKAAIDYLMSKPALFTANNIKRPAVLAAMVRLWEKDSDLGREAIDALAELNGSHRITQIAFLFRWMTDSRRASLGGGGVINKMLYCSTTYCLDKFLRGDTHEIKHMGDQRDYLEEPCYESRTLAKAAKT